MPPKLPQVPPNCDVWLGLRCVDKSVPGISVWTMTPGSHMEDAGGLVQNGFLAALADTAMAAAAVTADRYRSFVANTDLSMTFVNQVASGLALTCSARVVGGRNGATFVAADIVGPADALVARAVSTYVLTPRK